MEQKKLLITGDFILAALASVFASILFLKGSILFAIVFTIVSSLKFFVAVCYCTSLSSKKWLKRGRLLISIIFNLSIVAWACCQLIME